MSFDHRFGLGIGGSYEDPYIPPCCDDCAEDCDPNYPCKTMMDFNKNQAENMPVQEPPVPEDRGLDERWEGEI